MRPAFASGALVIVSVALALLIGEAVVRLLDIGPEFHAISYDNFQLSENPVLGYELWPNSADGNHRISDQGLRDEHYAVAKPDGVFRIAVIGDSITFGLRVAREANYTERLEYLLNAHMTGRAARYEVLNFGVVGYNITQIAENLRARVSTYQPDLVIYGYCLNDPQEYSLEMQRLLYLAAHRESGGAQKIPGVHSLLQRSQLFMLFEYLTSQHVALRSEAAFAPEEQLHWRNDPQFSAIAGSRHVEYFGRLHSVEGGWRRVEEGMQTISEFTTAPVVGVIFPLLEDLENYRLRPVHEKVGRQFASSAEGVVDLLDTFASFAKSMPRPVGIDALHPSEEGHWLAAGVITTYLAGHGFLPGIDARAVPRIVADPNLRALSLSSILQP
ncbi:MAG: SGNH/GDSL hydrolase family protein [Gammaproteobacteria bacterium]|nr:SGNH/GDSL hydrolase family protein [Gammaproteobacteria bacterium]